MVVIDWLIDMIRNMVVIDWLIRVGILLWLIDWFDQEYGWCRWGGWGAPGWYWRGMQQIWKGGTLFQPYFVLLDLSFRSPGFIDFRGFLKIMKLRNLIRFVPCNIFVFRSSTWSSTRSSRTRIRTQRSLSKYSSNSKTLIRSRYSFSRNSGLTTSFLITLHLKSHIQINNVLMFFFFQEKMMPNFFFQMYVIVITCRLMRQKQR